MNYIEVRWELPESDIARQLLLAFLEGSKAESVAEEPYALLAYFQESEFDDSSRVQDYLGDSLPPYSTKTMKQQNWNAEWEKNFEPIEIENRLRLRASFHPDRSKEFEREIVITPKMSFGTGHHSTTYLMMGWMLDEPIGERTLLDMGAGTGVLAILAALQGSTKAWAVDIDEWAYENAQENIEMNGVSGKIEVRLGSVEAIQDIQCDVLYANINRNILIDQLPHYARALRPGGALYMSGFYIEDLETIKKEAAKSGFRFEGWRERQQWVAAKWRLKG